MTSGVLSRLLGDETFEKLARRVNGKLWELRNKATGLHGEFRADLGRPK